MMMMMMMTTDAAKTAPPVGEYDDTAIGARVCAVTMTQP